MLFTKRLENAFLAAAILGLTASAARANLVANGGFEDAIDPQFLAGWGGYTFYSTPQGSLPAQGLPGWTVAGDSVDVVPDTYWTPAEGHNSLDLNGYDAGIAFQDLPVDAGKKYHLSFEATVNTDTGTAPRSMDVLWGPSLVVSLTLTGTGIPTAPGWQLYSYDVIAPTTPTSLRFESTSPGSAQGVALDAVSVVPVPLPAAAGVGFSTLGGFGMLAGLKKVFRRKARIA